MNTSTEMRDEFIRFLRWAGTHQATWRSVCADEALEPEECMEVIKELERNHFYLLIPVVIESSKNNYSVDKALYKFVLNKLADDWEEEQMDTILKELTEALRDV